MTTAWERAIEAVRDRAGRARPALVRAAEALGTSADGAERAVAALGTVGRLTLNLHPDRVAASGRTVAAGLLHDGRYLSQWATWISNGGRSAIAGGQRHGWERALFGDAYEGADPTADELPVYGAWDLLGDPFGGSPRFGSSFVVLHDDVRRRATFCVGDSHVGPTDVGTADEPASILAGLAEQAADGALLGRALGVAELEAVLSGEHLVDGPGRELDHYVEAQIHGGIDLATDVTAIVVDPSFRGTDVERDLEDAARHFGFELDWHVGSQLALRDVPENFRGPTMPDLAARVAGGSDVVDAAAIGRAARTLRLGPPLVDGDDPASEAQQLKYLWHTVLAFGHAARH